MAVMSVQELYEKYIKPLPVREQLQLVTLTAGALSGIDNADEPRERSLLELEGLGAHLWEGMDAQEYVRNHDPHGGRHEPGGRPLDAESEDDEYGRW